MTGQRQSVVVGLSDSVPDVLTLLRKSHDTEVTLEIPAASPLFLTANEFRALQALAELRKIKLSIASNDPLRLQLAALFKLQVAPVEQLATEAGSSDALPVFGPELPPEPEPENDELADSDKTEAISDDVESETTSPDNIQETPPAQDPLTGRFAPTITLVRTASLQQRLVVVGLVAAVALLAYLAAYQFLTRATVTLTLKREPVQQTLSVQVVTTGESSDGSTSSIVAQPVSIPVSTTRRAAATGVRLTGDTPARGIVTLSNPTEDVITVEAGTQFDDRVDGTTYAFVATASVPASSDDGPGFGQAEVVSVEAGTVGNREIGVLSGRLDSGLYFANRNAPIAGGTDQETSVVTQDDLDTLRTNARNDLVALASTHRLAANRVILAPSITIEEPTFTFSAEVGQEATEITVQASGQASALAYDSNELKAMALTALSANAPAESTIDPTSIRLSNATLDNADGTTTLTIEANGAAVAKISDERRRELAAGIAGKDAVDARAFSESQPEVAAFAISYSPSWLPARIPSDEDRVTIETT